jgi:5-methylcytosine-specific restriction endonuclease McrA
MAFSLVLQADRLSFCFVSPYHVDFQPLSYMPLSLWPWQEAVKAVVADRVSIVECYDFAVRSPSLIFPLPSVIALKQYQNTAERPPPFTRFNLFLRDSFMCQYCAEKHASCDLTFDHVLPRQVMIFP